MKIRYITIVVTLLLSLTGFSQRNTSAIIDTVESKSGTIILYRNYSWEYLDNEPVMLSQEEDSTGLFSKDWINNSIFALSNSKPDSIKDTVLMLISQDRVFTMPIYGKLFRGFMYTHKGLDIRLSKGDTIKAAFDGVVRYSKYNKGGFGNLIILRHYNGLETYYAHNSKLLVKVNQVVRSGDAICLGGSSGRSRGPHLHFEIRYKDVPLDPLKVIDYDNQRLISYTLPISKKIFYPSDYNVNAVYHKIRSGDTIGKLSKKYHTSIKEICAMNKITPKKTLRIGQTIRVK
jgi:murein DD-endopeptidase MepM/ murein hydrolase activator NlpD